MEITELKEKLEYGEAIKSQDFIQCLSNNKDDLRFEIPATPIDQTPSLKAKRTKTAFKLSEQHYRLQDGYKVELVPESRGFHSERFDLDEFIALLRQSWGRILLIMFSCFQIIIDI